MGVIVSLRVDRAGLVAAASAVFVHGGPLEPETLARAAPGIGRYPRKEREFLDLRTGPGGPGRLSHAARESAAALVTPRYCAMPAPVNLSRSRVRTIRTCWLDGLSSPLLSKIANPQMPILEAHAPHETVQTWKGFFVHIATITIGLLIAIALEQCVEGLHHLHQRHQLQHDLLEEATRNRNILTTDLELAVQLDWFRSLLTALKSVSTGGQAAISLPVIPCIPGTIGANGTDNTVASKYFAPSDAVWVTARDAGLIIQLPAEEARMYARLAHNYDLQAAARDRFAYACERIYSLHTRYAVAASQAHQEIWTLSRERADEVAAAAADADTTLRALMWRTRWNLSFEEGIVRGAKNYDEVLMKVVSERH
jgi:hypothetical protein